MTKIKNTGAYPIKKYPVATDFFIGSDSENSGETVNFEIQTIVNMASGLMDYIYSKSSLPLTAPTGNGYFLSNGITDFSLITHLSVSKITLAGQNLTPYINFLKVNTAEFTLKIISKTNQNIFTYYAINAITEHTDYFVFDVVLAPGNNYLGELKDKDIYTFVYEKIPGEGPDLITQTITDGDTTHAPSADAVYDAFVSQDNNVIHKTGFPTETKEGQLIVTPVDTSITAIIGNSIDGAGVIGNSDNGPGVIGTSTDNFGVSGQGPVGVRGSSVLGTGVQGISSDGIGVEGLSSTGSALKGTSTTGIGVVANSVLGFKLASFQANGIEMAYVNALGDYTGNKFVKTGGTALEYLMADGSVSTLSGIGSGLIAPTIVDGDTTHAPSGDAVFDALALKVSNIVAGTNISVNSFDPQNPIISAIPATSAGIFDRVYFTGQVATIATPVAPNYDTIRNGKGSVASISLISPPIAASSKVFFTNDMIGPAQTVAGSLPTGNFTSFLSVLPSAIAALKRFTIEIFLCDSAGVIIPQAGPPSTDPSVFYAGKNTVVILDSGNLTLPASNTSVGLSGYLSTPLNVAVGQRFRYHISVARGAGGGAQTMNINIGNTWNSYTEAPVPLTTSTVLNVSTVPGATATDALNALLATSHSPVTIGTANGLSLATQVLSLGLASTSTTGALSSTDWNTFNNKQPLLTNPITGTGTAGQVSFWSGVNTQSGDNGLFWDNANKQLKLIGTSNTATSLEIIGINQTLVGVKNTLSTSQSVISSSNDGTGAISIGVNGTTYVTSNSYGGANDAFVRSSSGAANLNIISSSGRVSLFTGGTEKLSVLVNGNVGINNTNAQQNLTIQGTSSFADVALGLYSLTASGNANARNWAIRTNTATYGDFSISQSNAKDGNPVTAGTSVFYISPIGNVGIGTTTPSAKLAIDGSIAIDSGLTNTSTRPAPGVGTMTNGEIRGYNDNIPAGDFGFLRLSAGGGTAGVKSYIDLTGSSTIPDMHACMVFGTAGGEAMRINNAKNLGIGVVPTTNLYDKLQVNGNVVAKGLKLNIRTITASTTVVETDYTVLCDATTSAITLTLLPASSSSGAILIVKKINNTANNITIDPFGTELIDNASTFVLTTYLQSVTIQSNGTSWFIIN